MKKILLLFVMVLGVIPTMWADISVQTIIFDENSQPPIVGGIIDGYSADAIVKKGIIVSSSIDDAVYKEEEYWYNASYYSDDSKSVDSNLKPMEIKDYRILDCTIVGKKQFWCSLKLLKPNCDYYVRAFVVNNDETVSLGNIEKLHTESFDRYYGKSDYANVWYAFDYTLFDLVTDEIINPNNGFYYSTNDNPTTVRHQVGTGYNTCYKFATEWNYKLWYYHNANHSDKNKMINHPIMSYSNGKLSIEKNPLDADKDITIYYSINGNYFRPETYTDVYTAPIEITEPCAVYCYAISSDGYISYTNMYYVEQTNDVNEFGTVADVVDLGLSVKWASWNVGASKIADYGGLYGAGDPTGNRTNYSIEGYHRVVGECISGSEYDLATIKWGEEWRMPTIDELKELREKCTWESNVIIDGVKGVRGTGPNGNNIFFPCAGTRQGTYYVDKDQVASVWSGNVGSDYPYGYEDLDLYFSGTISINGNRCYIGQSIRPIYVEETDTEDVHEYVDVCGVKWARGNLQYDAVNGGGESFQANWRIAPNQWHFFRYDEGITSYQTSKTDKQIDHFTWGVCGEWDYLNDVKIYSTAKNSDINAKMFTDADCKTITTDYESAKYGDIAYWASNGQYRLPTAEEIDLLINTASYQFGYYLTTEGVKINGCLFTTPTDGRITDSNYKLLTDNDLKKGLFIPIAGGSHTNRTVIEGLFNGESSYWTSTVEFYPQAIQLTYNYPHRGKYNSYSGHWASDLRSIRPVFIQRITEASNIESIYGVSNADAVIYNLQGQRLQTVTKGINIVNGKKVIIK